MAVVFRVDGGRQTEWRSRIDWTLVVSLCSLAAVLGLYWYRPLAPALHHGVAPAAAAVQPGPAVAQPPAPAEANAGMQPQQVDAQQSAQQQQQQQQRTRWFKPVGYHLPEECLKHEDLYLGIVENLRPWMATGITRTDLDACGVPIAPNASYINTARDGNHRAVLLQNKVHITSGGLWRGQGKEQPLYMHFLTVIQMAADRFGLPDMEFVVGFGRDIGKADKPGANGGLCPVFTYCKSPNDFDLLLPDGHFIEAQYDLWLNTTSEPDVVPWEEKEEKVYGRFMEYEPAAPPLDRYGVKLEHLRKDYANYSHTLQQTNATRTDIGGEFSSLGGQRRFKYTLNLDGIGCSTRFQQLLATGQTVIKQESPLRGFFYYALQPWVHYVPTGWNGISEIDAVVAFLRQHDALARRIGENSKRFAHDHLNEEGRLCYVKVLMEEMKRLMRREVRAEDFPSLITYEEEVENYFTEQEKRGLKHRVIIV
ncbi:hypothetical protein ABPG75_001750 [Micractinium tetrahymenae]